MSTTLIQETFKCSSGVEDIVTVIYYDHDEHDSEGPGVREDGLHIICESEEGEAGFNVFLTDQQVEDMATTLNYYLHQREVRKQWQRTKYGLTYER